MRTHARLAAWIAVMMLLALGLSGCFRSVGEDLEPTQAGAVPQIPQPGGTATTEPESTPDLTPSATADDLAPTADQMTQLPSPVDTTEDGTPSLTPFPTFADVTLTPFPTTEDGQGGPFAPPPTATPTGVIANTVAPAEAQATDTPVPTQRVQETYTPLPTYTPFPTSTPYPTSTTLPTSTQQPSRTPRPTATALSPVGGPTQTFTPVPFRTFAPTSTYTPYPVSALAGVQSIAVVPTSPPVPTATPVQPGVAAEGEAVPLAERETAAVDATPFGGPDVATTPAPADVPQGGGTPPLDGGATEVAMVQATPLSPGQQTATMIVYEATATSAALTGTPLATLTPPGVAPLDQGAPGATQPAQPAQQQAIPPGQFPANATVITATPFGQGGICDEHLIQLGETLYSIALRYDVTAEEIQQANPAEIPTIDDITAGTTINIPCPTPVTPTPQPVPVVTNVPDGQGGPITSGSGTMTTATQPLVHVVVPGDTLFSIARQYGVDVYDLIRANNYTTRTMNYIVEGEEIIIPGQTVAVTAAPPAGATAAPGVAPTLTPYIVIVTPAVQ